MSVLPPSTPAIESDERDVLLDREVREQIVGLVHHADVLSSESHPVPLGERGHDGVADRDRAAGGEGESGEQIRAAWTCRSRSDP